MNNKGVVTATNPTEIKRFIQDFVNAIAMHRHWNRDKKDKVPA